MNINKNKILKAFSGLITLSGLAMLFSGLIEQVLLAPNFGAGQQLVNLNWVTLALIAGGVVLTLFGGNALLILSSNKRFRHVHVRVR